MGIETGKYARPRWHSDALDHGKGRGSRDGLEIDGRVCGGDRGDGRAHGVAGPRRSGGAHRLGDGDRRYSISHRRQSVT
jgi:hypothetical protein